VTPTRWTNLLGTTVLTGVLGWVLADRAYGDLVSLPTYAPVTAVLIAFFELGLARVISQKVRGRSSGRPMHPLQVARAVVLAKASSVAGALLLGLYAGFFTWTFSERDRLAAAGHDAVVSGISAGASLLLVVGALLLERACRTPPSPDGPA
jgi:hypothetical protein